MAQSGVAMDSFVQRAIVAAIETEALETTMALLEAREGALDKLPRAFFGAAAKIIDDSCTGLPAAYRMRALLVRCIYHRGYGISPSQEVGTMGHTIREKTKLLNRIRRLRGQVDAIERALEGEIGCAEVMRLVVAVRGAANGLMAEVMEDHIRFHIADPARDPDPQRAEGADQLIDVIHSYLK